MYKLFVEKHPKAEQFLSLVDRDIFTIENDNADEADMIIQFEPNSDEHKEKPIILIIWNEEIEELSEYIDYDFAGIINMNSINTQYLNHSLRKSIEKNKSNKEKLRKYMLEKIEKSFDYVILVNRNGRISYISRIGENLLGYPENQLLDSDIYSLIKSEKLEEIKVILKKDFLSSAGEVDVQIRNIRGFYTNYELTINNFTNDKILNGYILGFKNNTIKIKFNNVLIESQKRYEMLFNNLNDFIFVFQISNDGIPGTILEANEAFQKFLKNTKEELSFLTVEEIIESSYLDNYSEVLKNLFEEKHNLYECDFVNKENKKLAVEINSHLFILNGYYTVLCVARDITERKNADEKLKRSFADFKLMLYDTVNALALTTEKKDPYTAGHQKNVSQLAYAIGQKMNLSKDVLEGIKIASLLHDIGKISVPSELLNKPGKLLSVEMELIKIHSSTGYDILKNISFPWPIAQIVYQHHERIDGTGYPNQLKEHEILIEAKIIALADVVEAMASHRPYRPALGIAVAMEEIRSKAGIIYDKTIAEICLELFEKDNFKFERWAT